MPDVGGHCDATTEHAQILHDKNNNVLMSRARRRWRWPMLDGDDAQGPTDDQDASEETQSCEIGEERVTDEEHCAAQQNTSSLQGRHPICPGCSAV